MVGLKPDIDAFLICCACATLLCNTVVSWGYMLSSAAGESNRATLLAGPLTIPFILFGGFLLNDASIPWYFIWLKWLSWFKYANEIFIVNQWHNFGPIGCEFMPPPLPPHNGSSVIPPAPSHFSNSSIPSGMCFRTGEDVVTQFNYGPDNILRDFILLAVLFAVFRFIGFIFLLLRANPIRLRRRTPHDPVSHQVNPLEPNMSVIHV